jgi:DNA-binding NtrC family response regulator
VARPNEEGTTHQGEEKIGLIHLTNSVKISREGAESQMRALVFSSDAGAACPDLLNALQAMNVVLRRAGSRQELLRLLEQQETDLVFIEDDAGAVAAVRQIDRSCRILLMVPTLSVELLLNALRIGVNDVLTTSCTRCEISETLTRLLPVQGGMTLPANGVRLIGGSEAMVQVRRSIAQVAASRSNVLITGETGTGKELVAELIHNNSSRRGSPFVSINCAALPDLLLESELFGYERGAFTGAQASRTGRLQFANSGTVFLDEVGDMSLSAQAKILRVIENRRLQRLGGNHDIAIDIRVIAATNRNLETLVEENQFRKDLYYRLNVARIHLPPLRERRIDIPALLNHVVADLNGRSGMAARELVPDVIKRLIAYDWPGNVRELRNVIESAFVFGSSHIIRLGDLPEQLRTKLDCEQGGEVADYERERSRVIHALNSTEWNRTEAARVLHWSRMTLYRKMRKYEIVSSSVSPRNTVSVAATA